MSQANSKSLRARINNFAKKEGISPQLSPLDAGSPHNPDKGKQVVSNDADVVNSQTEVIGKMSEVGVEEPEVGVVSSEVGVNPDTKTKENNSSHTACGFLETEISRLNADAAIWYNLLVSCKESCAMTI